MPCGVPSRMGSLRAIAARQHQNTQAVVASLEHHFVSDTTVSIRPLYSDPPRFGEFVSEERRSAGARDCCAMRWREKVT
jgi:hypothetical protein